MKGRPRQLPTPNFQLPTLNSQVPTANSQLPTPNFQLSQLPTPNWQLANSQPPTPNRRGFYVGLDFRISVATIFTSWAHSSITGSCAGVSIPVLRRTRRRNDVSFNSRKTICRFARTSFVLDPSSASSVVRAGGRPALQYLRTKCNGDRASCVQKLRQPCDDGRRN